MSVTVSDVPFDPAAALAQFIAATAGAGAVVSFVGLTRGHAHDGTSVGTLHLQPYRGVTLASIEAIAAATRDHFAVSAVMVVHRIGAIAPGDAIVFAAAAAPHRRAAFDAADYLMDRLKTEAVLWKREDDRWIEPSAADHAARARWDGA